VKITLTNTNTGAERSAISDGIGNYEIPVVMPGTYHVSAEGAHFNKFELKYDLELLVNTPAMLNFEMALGVRIEINLTDATVGNAMSRRQIEQLPLEDRNPGGLMSFQPSVVYTGINDSIVPDTRGGSVAGGRSDQNNTTVDGVDANNQQTGKAFEAVIPVTLDSTQEFRVVTVNANADQGRSSAGQVSLVTRSGGNRLSGSFYEYQRNAVTSANDFFNNSTIDSITGKSLERPKFNRNIFGGSLGGPILRNKLFFFVNVEDTITRREEPQLRLVPSATLRQGTLSYFDTARVVKTVTPEQLKAMDPLNIGPNSAILALMRQYPVGNDPTQGDGGLNFTGFRFNGPLKEDKPSYIGRIDYYLNSRHRIFVRGSVADYKVDIQAPQFPGQPASQVMLDRSKGIAVGHTFAVSPNLMSAFHWGLTRQSLNFTGGNTNPGLGIRGMDSLQNLFARNNGRTLPTHNLLEDLTWVREGHTLQFGVNYRNIHNKRFSEEKTYPRYSSNSGWMENVGLDVLPATISPDFQIPYINAQMALLGTIDQVEVTYFVNRSGAIFPTPHVPRREFISNELEWYAQDQWKIRSNLTLTAGVRYSYFAPPYEKNGFQVRANFDVNSWFATRRDGGATGIPSNANPLLSFVLAGKANNAQPTFDPDKNNFAPRLAVAWSPGFQSGPLHAVLGDPGESSIRFGVSMLYDRTGGMFPVTTDLNGAVGLSTFLVTPVAAFNYDTAPRFSGIQGLSSIPAPSAPTAGFPSTPSFTNNTGFMVDTKLRTPYSTTINFSISRNLPGAMTVEAAYVGRFGRKLLVQNDIAAPLVNFKDPKSGQTWVAASGVIADLLDKNTPTANVPAIPFFENVFAPLAAPGMSASQSFYGIMLGAGSSWTDALHFLDTSPTGSTIYGPHTFFQQQFDWLPTWTNLGQSSYHSFQLIVRKRLTRGLQADFNYTLARSIDNGSSVESEGPGYGQILNAFAPRQSRGNSDFDIRHQVNSNFMLDVPVGNGRQFLANMPPVMNGIISGWSLSGLLRWRTGFPFPQGSGNGFAFPTNYFVPGPPTLVPGAAVPVTEVTKNGPNGPNIFEDPQAAYDSFQHTRSGFSGNRNIFHGPGFFTLDTGLQRTFKVSEKQKIQFRWETYNLTNTANFDGRPNAALNRGIDFDLDAKASFGKLKSTAGSPRIMQFALRFEF